MLLVFFIYVYIYIYFSNTALEWPYYHHKFVFAIRDFNKPT